MEETKTLVYTETRCEFPEFIKSTINAYNSLGIRKTNIWQNLREEFENFLNIDLKWVKFAKNLPPEVANYLDIHFMNMTNWLFEWNENANILPMFENLLKELKIALLTMILYHTGRRIEEFTNLARNTYDVHSKKKFENLISIGKKDYFLTYLWGNGVSLNWNEFIRTVDNDLKPFCGGINRVYEKEIKKDLHIQENIMRMDLDRFFNYIWGSQDSFARFINRNYLYGLLETGLEKNFTNYQRIQSEWNTRIPALRLHISKCKLETHRHREYLLEIDGIHNSNRFLGDKIVTFGKEDYEEFSNDISLPKIEKFDSIVAFIYTNNNGFNLVDISQNGIVNVKVNEIRPIEIVEGMIIVFGNIHAFQVNFIPGPTINGKKSSIPIISGSNTCVRTKNFSPVHPNNLDEPFTIGKNPNNDLVINYEDISEQHARMYWDRKRNKWFLVDGSVEKGASRNGTFYKLKTRTEIDTKVPSSALLLEVFTVFMIQDYLFIALNPEHL